jgi:arabinose-5-phosphate isomerase
MLALLEHLSRLGVRTIAITGKAASRLARHCTVALDASVREEACPHDLAPTTSTTTALALGDALAVALLEEKGFKREDFARLHPGGALGRRLLLRVTDVMLTDKLPILAEGASLRETVVALAEQRGIVVASDNDRRVLGVFTAGDLARLMEHETDIFGIRLGDVMTRSPKMTTDEELASAVIFRMEQHGIMAMPVVNADERLVGVIHLHDLMRAGAG